MSKHHLDELDRAILLELEDDGRRSFREIARNTDIPEATIRARFKRLQELNILRIVAFADPEELGDVHLSLVLVHADPSKFQQVIDALVEFPQVTYVSTLLGSADICVEVSSHDNNDLWEFLTQQVRTIPGVINLESNSILKVHKLRYTTPVTES